MVVGLFGPTFGMRLISALGSMHGISFIQVYTLVSEAPRLIVTSQWLLLHHWLQAMAGLMVWTVGSRSSLASYDVRLLPNAIVQTHKIVSEGIMIRYSFCFSFLPLFAFARLRTPRLPWPIPSRLTILPLLAQPHSSAQAFHARTPILHYPLPS